MLELMEWELFTKVEPNPTVEVAEEIQFRACAASELVATDAKLYPAKIQAECEFTMPLRGKERAEMLHNSLVPWV